MRHSTSSMQPAELQHYPIPLYYLPGCDVSFSSTYDLLLGVNRSLCATTLSHENLTLLRLWNVDLVGATVARINSRFQHPLRHKPWDIDMNFFQSIYSPLVRMTLLHYVTSFILIGCLATVL